MHQDFARCFEIEHAYLVLSTQSRTCVILRTRPHSGLHSYADSEHPLTRAAAKVTVATTVDTRQSRSHCSTGPTLQYAINNIYRTFADKRLRNDKACCCCSGRGGGAAARSTASRPSSPRYWTLALLSLLEVR